MPGAHLDGFMRACGAITKVTGQKNTFVNKRLWAVEGDQNSHGGGDLIPTKRVVFINKKPVITNAPDAAGADALCGIVPGAHCAPSTAQGAMKTFAYGSGGEGPPFVEVPIDPTLVVVDLFAINLVVGPPVISIEGIVNLFASDLIVSAPALTSPAFVASGAVNLVVGSPTLGSPTFSATGPVGLTVGSPVLGVPVFSSIRFNAANLAVGSPVINVATINAIAAAREIIYPVGTAPVGGMSS